MYPPAPVLPEILRQHAEQAAFLWTVYDRAMLFPEENPEMDALRIARLLERLEAHLDGLRVAGAEGLRVAEARFAEYPEAGELFVVRMLQPGAEKVRVADLDWERVRGYLTRCLDQPP
ncbi:MULTISPECIES: hypothetical protein [unclassified Paracoccus (in: a-proteobacteria)]|uniref:hypothetical protein n=1 Tax=unclassified Paracoccus (in: a-proteobacteria) TaxID=2688777 RepID=UPI0016043A7A|nr:MULTISPECIES: hypothetical protein [unclassified Paracoccus (in: a-proteobacteria)]MBB1490603.1 hypothetical protein [Paracoccus sp. MC1854]MBB1499057.1 hypothetical protein [Paracoccus sp. MC1862]QQO46058.1 hypothetical protein JGR78_07260 [Paracoccus sp. MC1862]